MKARIALIISILVCLAVGHFSGYFDSYYLYVAETAGINIILAVSLNLINGHTGQFSLGHAGFMSIGAYTAAMLTLTFANGHLPQPVLFGLALLAGGVTAAIVGLVVGIPSLRLKGDYLAIVTLGFGEIIRVIFQNTNAVGGARGLSGIPGYTNFFWVFSLAAITIYVVATLVNSTYGRGFLAVRDDEISAEAMGINTTKYKVLAFVIGAFFAGIAGGLYAHQTQFIGPKGFGFMKSVEIVIIVILGGMGNTIGVVIAAIALTVLNEYLRDFNQFRMIVFALLLIIMMIARPQGLLGDLAWLRRRRNRRKL